MQETGHERPPPSMEMQPRRPTFRLLAVGLVVYSMVVLSIFFMLMSVFESVKST